MFHRRPAGLNTLETDAGGAIARMASVEGFSRGILVGVVPLIALEALGSKEAVAHTYLMGAIFTLLITLNFNSLERILKRRRVVVASGIFIILAALCLFYGEGMVFALGIGLRSAAASLFSVCLSLYIMDYIGKRDLAWSESRRMLYNGLAWLIAPTLGIWLWNTPYKWLAVVFSGFAAVGMMAYFWYLRFGDNQIVRAAKSVPANPVKIIPRYFQQRKLRISYLITITRSIFWVTAFVYGPIYIVESGLPKWVAGIFLSCVSGLLFLSPLIRRVSEGVGTRRVLVIASILCGVTTIAIGLLGEPKPIGLLLWMLAAIGAVALDVLGNIPFMRLVKPRERTEMTMVFSTWREASELVTPLLVSATLLVAPFEVFYLIVGVLLLLAAFYANQLPRRL